MLSLTEFVDAFCSLTPEKQTALEEFLTASREGLTLEQTIERVSNEEIRNEYREILRAEGKIA